MCHDMRVEEERDLQQKGTNEVLQLPSSPLLTGSSADTLQGQ